MNISDILNKYIVGLDTTKYNNTILYFNDKTKNALKINQTNIPTQNIYQTRIICTSDTHTLHRNIDIPKCDIFIHNGDIALQGRVYSDDDSISFYKDFNEWLKKIPATYKIVIGGNHDYYLEKIGEIQSQKLLSNCKYLVNSLITINGLNILGSPINIGNSKNKAFQSKIYFDKFLEKLENNKIDILLTHSNVIDPIIIKKYDIKYHIWGHYHENYGIYEQIYKGYKWMSICTCALDSSYSLKNGPVIIDY